MNNTDMPLNPEHGLTWQFVNDLKEPANNFMADCYASEVRAIDEADDMTTEQKLNARRKTNLIYGGISLIGLVVIAVIQKACP